MTQPSLNFSGPREQDTETRRRENNKTRVLERLRLGPATTMQLVEIGGIRATGRISDLRREGYVIECDDRGKGLCVYSLKREGFDLDAAG